MARLKALAKEEEHEVAGGWELAKGELETRRAAMSQVKVEEGEAGAYVALGLVEACLLQAWRRRGNCVAEDEH